jgi:hypothetical protein
MAVLDNCLTHPSHDVFCNRVALRYVHLDGKGPQHEFAEVLVHRSSSIEESDCGKDFLNITARSEAVQKALEYFKEWELGVCGALQMPGKNAWGIERLRPYLQLVPGRNSRDQSGGV